MGKWEKRRWGGGENIKLDSPHHPSLLVLLVLLFIFKLATV
jgi:hypothetical protein